MPHRSAPAPMSKRTGCPELLKPPRPLTRSNQQRAGWYREMYLETDTCFKPHLQQKGPEEKPTSSPVCTLKATPQMDNLDEICS